MSLTRTLTSKKKIRSALTSVKSPSAHDIDRMIEIKDPQQAIASGKVMVSAWFKQQSGEEHLDKAHAFIQQVLKAYWERLSPADHMLPVLNHSTITLDTLDTSLSSLAQALGLAAAQLEIIEASYEIGNLYTAILPENIRNGNGVFYTPPVLTNRLLDMIEETGVSWAKATVIDPACGGGAFLAPVALRMVSSLQDKTAEEIITHIEGHLKGLEIDPFSAWITQVMLEQSLAGLIIKAGRRIRPIVTVTDSLHYQSEIQYDVVVGNPPYGKVKLEPFVREKYQQSLFGHANYYGLFTHLALHLCRKGGTIGYLTPTSFLSGEYFKNLRALLQSQTRITQIDVVESRKKVFDDVLQETMLATYIKTNQGTQSVKVNAIHPRKAALADIEPFGEFRLPENHQSPWLLARDISQQSLIQAMAGFGDSLSSWGYRISTGQLVWNRHKEQLATSAKNAYPIIWAESITPQGSFLWKTERKNHAPYLQAAANEDFLLTKKSCILLQRTTAKEQHKRLISAVLPQDFVNQHGSVVVENHLNMIIATSEKPKVSLTVLNAFLNSKAVNDAFRTISGSVAVSAYELEHLPLPKPLKLKKLASLLESGAGQQEIETECLKLYTRK